MRRGSGCKYPSDLIYSLLGTTMDSLDLNPNYDTPFEYVFADSAAHIIEGTGNLSILSDVTTSLDGSDLPTWVPDWSVSRHRQLYFPGQLSSKYACTGSSRAVPQPSSNLKEMTLPGLYLDQIVVLGDATIKDRDEWLQQHLTELHKLEGHYSLTVESSSDTLVRISCADLTLFDPKSPDSRWKPTSHQHVRQVIDECEKGLTDRFYRFVRSHADRVGYGRLVVTQGQRLGLVPNNAQAGDIITLLLGGNVPIILRPDGQRYTFIGECFIDGVMDGEGLVEARRNAQIDGNHKVFDRSVPFVLRMEGQEYVFINECFIDRVRNGEKLVEAKKEVLLDENHEVLGGELSIIHCPNGRKYTFVGRRFFEDIKIDERFLEAKKKTHPEKMRKMLSGKAAILMRPKGERYSFIEKRFMDSLMDIEEDTEAQKQAQPKEDHEDTSWLTRLHEEPLPFETQDFVIIQQPSLSLEGVQSSGEPTSGITSICALDSSLTRN
jgi:hypothetical protein